MTETEIKKALECHKERELDTCGGCPYFNIDGCAYQLSEDALDLINRKEAKIDRLEQNLKEAHIDIREQMAEVERLKSVEESHREQNGELRTAVERLNIENLQMIASIKGLEERARAEAIKEFAERLKAEFIDGWGCIEFCVDELEQIAKEMGVEL